MALSERIRPCSITDSREFANHVTINLFKKRNILRSNTRQSRLGISRRTGGPLLTKSIKVANGKSHQQTPSTDGQTAVVECSRTTQQNSTELTDFSSLEQITSQVITPFASTIISEHAMDLDAIALFNNSNSFQPLQKSPITEIQLSTTPPIEHSPCKKKKSSTPNDDLTPLSWLQSLDMGGVVPHLAAPPTPPASPPLNTGVNATVTKFQKDETPSERIDYSMDGSVKPPFSYAALIGMAMKENENKMTLSAIYKWIKDHYVFYKTADQSWQNSIRHNLSLNKCFLKVARSKEEPGKGGFWKLDPEYAESLVDGVFKKRRPSKTTAPPTTKAKRPKRAFSITQQQQIQQQVQKQRQIEQDELLRQKEQEDAVRSLLLPVQAAYMPPPTDKPPMTVGYLNQQDATVERSLLGDDSNNQQLKDDFVWSSFLGDDTGQEDTWQLGAQEVVTDITQSGDPSTYQLTASPTPSSISLSSSTNIMNNFSVSNLHPITASQQQQQHIQNLPSFELSPASLGVEDDLFGTPEYSESSTDEGDSLISSFDLGVGLDLAISTTSWNNKANVPCNVYNIIDTNKPYQGKELNIVDQSLLMNVENVNDLVEFHDFEGNLTQLTTLEPAAPLVVQQIHQPNWNQIQSVEEANNFSILEANLDFDKLIDLDVI